MNLSFAITVASSVISIVATVAVALYRVGQLTDAVREIREGLQRQGERIGVHDTRLAVLDDRLEHTSPGSAPRRRPTKGIPGAGE